MKPLMMIFGLSLLLGLLGWTWSERPRPATLFTPFWTSSYQLYQQPHAIWLNEYHTVGGNVKTLNRVLKAASQARQIPEIVIYTIPMRDLGQASEGGFANENDYMADNRLNAGLIRGFFNATGISPVVYLEPDSLSLAVQYQRDENNSPESKKIYQDRIRMIQALIGIYREAGARVYLDAGHSGWFDYTEADLLQMAQALNEASVDRASGIVTNVSNRQPVTLAQRSVAPLQANAFSQQSEAHYLRRLLPLLNHPHLDVRVDTSRNGGVTLTRQYYLSPNGQLIDNETQAGRWVGHWETDTNGVIRLFPFFGKPKTLSRLTGKEKYHYDTVTSLLTAPAWLDAVGDVQIGSPPTDQPPQSIASVIQHFRYIKPPDDCDGALNYPPGASKHHIQQEIQKRQSGTIKIPAGLFSQTKTSP